MIKGTTSGMGLSMTRLAETVSFCGSISAIMWQGTVLKYPSSSDFKDSMRALPLPTLRRTDSSEAIPGVYQLPRCTLFRMIYCLILIAFLLLVLVMQNSSSYRMVVAIEHIATAVSELRIAADTHALGLRSTETVLISAFLDGLL
jgi:hypothetical protein